MTVACALPPSKLLSAGSESAYNPFSRTFAGQLPKAFKIITIDVEESSKAKSQPSKYAHTNEAVGASWSSFE